MKQPLTSSAGFGILGLILALSASAALESGVYQTLSVATVEERGDRVPNGSRVVPIAATVTLDLWSTPPSLTAVITNAVLEGGNPFPLTLRSSSGVRLLDGTYRFTGDYLGDLYASGTQYLFDWTFSASTNGQVVWNGLTDWAGGHMWQVAITNLTLEPQARLNISHGTTGSVQIGWATAFGDYVLESATNLTAAGWSTVTNQVTTNANRLFVTLAADAADASPRFYRLRKP